MQTIIPTIADDLFTDLTERDAHIYVCGDVGMATGVIDGLKKALVSQGMLEVEAVKFLDTMRVSLSIFKIWNFSNQKFSNLKFPQWRDLFDGYG